MTEYTITLMKMTGYLCAMAGLIATMVCFAGPFTKALWNGVHGTGGVWRPQ